MAYSTAYHKNSKPYLTTFFSQMVLKKFIELSEQKVTEAQSKADEVQSNIDSAAAAASSIEDLEASETPESILLSTVSGEQSRDRTDRAIVTPWLKFLWETYRTVLDILRNNARLESLYQVIWLIFGGGMCNRRWYLNHTFDESNEKISCRPPLTKHFNFV